MKVDGTVYWTLMTYDTDGILVDADSVPTVAVRKNGASVADAVTVTKRSATTGIYDCSHNPAGEADGDSFTYEESATISSQVYMNPWSLEVVSSDANIVSISGDSTAADNLELQYNGITGLSGDLFPATQGSIRGLGTGTTGAVNFKATGDNTVSPIKGATFVGSVQAGSYLNTDVEDGVYFEIDDVGNVIDVVLSYDLGGSNVGTEVEIFANLSGNSDRMDVQVYNFDSTSWDKVGELAGVGGQSFQRLNISLLSQNTGTGTDLGLVFVRLSTSITSPNTIEIDKVIVGAVSKSRSVGYADGSVWVNTSTGVAGTESFVNGVADNPCSSYSQAATIAGNVGLVRYTFSPADIVAITQSHSVDVFRGSNYQLNLNNQFGPTLTSGAEVIGVNASTVTTYYQECRAGTISTSLELNAGAVFETCGLVNVKLKDSAGAALDVEFLDCHGNTQGSMFPGGTVDFGLTAGTNHEVSFQRWGGPVTIVNLKDGDTVYAHGNGTFILDASCTGGSFRVAGMINLVDNSGLVSILEDGRITKSGIADAIWDEAIADHLAAGSTGESLNAAGAAGDPWTTTLPGTYTGSQAGKILADVLEDTGTTLPTAIDNIDTVVDLIKVDTASILVDTGTTIPAQITALNDPTAADIADAIWDEAAIDHQIIGSFGSAVNFLASTVFRDDLVDAVWDEAQSGHTIAGTFGAYLDAQVSAAGGGSSDWTATEKNQIRYMLGIDGATAVPSATSGIVTATWSFDDGNGLGDKSTQVYATLTTNLSIENVTDRLDGMLVLNGEGTTYQYTVDALENAPIADVSGLATSANLESVALVTLDTNSKVNLLPSATDVVDAWGNQPQGVYTTPDTLGFYLDAQVSTAGAGGSGLYQATVRVQDSSSNALQGARVNIDGTTLTLTTGVSGEVQFNLDSGVYLLEVSPPANYDTPAGQVLTITSGDPSQTVFTLSETTPPSGCDVPWIG